tara:strand:+ start:7785 stop:8561 length:777 start_codon:yes stop_codon:yes gene_type:complete
MINPMSVNVNTRIRWEAIKDMAPFSDLAGKTVLDIGAGLGYFTERFLERGAKVTALDIDRQALRFVKENLGVPTIVLDIEHDTLPEAAFDVIFIGEVIEHVHEPDTAIAAVARALKPDGSIVVTTPALEGILSYSAGKQLGHNHGGQKHERVGFAAEELASMIESVGLTVKIQKSCLYVFAELFMQLTKVGFLIFGKGYEGQSDVLAKSSGPMYRAFRVVFAVAWPVILIGEAIAEFLGVNGHCNVLVASKQDEMEGA